MKSRSIATILAFLPMVAFVPHASAAVDEDESKVYDARLEGYDTNVTLDGSSTALLWLLLVVLGAVCVGVMFMDAKRSHLD